MSVFIVVYRTRKSGSSVFIVLHQGQNPSISGRNRRISQLIGNEVGVHRGSSEIILQNCLEVDRTPQDENIKLKFGVHRGFLLLPDKHW